LTLIDLELSQYACWRAVWSVRGLCLAAQYDLNGFVSCGWHQPEVLVSSWSK